MTKYEKRIYDIVNTSCTHMTAEQIFAALKETHPGVSRATVYNNLNKLCDTKLIKRISGEGFADRFDHSCRHDHLICQKCKKLVDVNLEDLTESLKEQLDTDFLCYELKVVYICPECRKSNKSS